jgi:hypothetical protein
MNSVQLFIKLLFRYLEHLHVDTLRLGHAKRLMSWVRLYPVIHCLFFKTRDRILQIHRMVEPNTLSGITFLALCTQLTVVYRIRVPKHSDRRISQHSSESQPSP